MLNSTKLRIRLLESQVKKHEIPDLLLGFGCPSRQIPTSWILTEVRIQSELEKYTRAKAKLQVIEVRDLLTDHCHIQLDMAISSAHVWKDRGWGWGITLLGLFSPQKGSQELTLPKSDSRGYVVRNQWSRTSRSPSTRPPSAEESRSKNTSLKVEMGTKGKSTLQNNSNNNSNVH